MSSQLRYTESAQRRPQLVLNGHLYNQFRETEEEVHLKCVMYYRPKVKKEEPKDEKKGEENEEKENKEEKEEKKNEEATDKVCTTVARLSKDMKVFLGLTTAHECKSKYPNFDLCKKKLEKKELYIPEDLQPRRIGVHSKIYPFVVLHKNIEGESKEDVEDKVSLEVKQPALPNRKDQEQHGSPVNPATEATTKENKPVAALKVAPAASAPLPCLDQLSRTNSMSQTTATELATSSKFTSDLVQVMPKSGAIEDPHQMNDPDMSNKLSPNTLAKDVSTSMVRLANNDWPNEDSQLVKQADVDLPEEKIAPNKHDLQVLETSDFAARVVVAFAVISLAAEIAAAASQHKKSVLKEAPESSTSMLFLPKPVSPNKFVSQATAAKSTTSSKSTGYQDQVAPEIGTVEEPPSEKVGISANEVDVSEGNDSPISLELKLDDLNISNKLSPKVENTLAVSKAETASHNVVADGREAPLANPKMQDASQRCEKSQQPLEDILTTGVLVQETPELPMEEPLTEGKKSPSKCDLKDPTSQTPEWSRRCNLLKKDLVHFMEDHFKDIVPDKASVPALLEEQKCDAKIDYKINCDKQNFVESPTTQAAAFSQPKAVTNPAKRPPAKSTYLEGLCHHHRRCNTNSIENKAVSHQGNGQGCQLCGHKTLSTTAPKLATHSARTFNRATEGKTRISAGGSSMPARRKPLATITMAAAGSQKKNIPKTALVPTTKVHELIKVDEEKPAEVETNFDANLLQPADF